MQRTTITAAGAAATLALALALAACSGQSGGDKDGGGSAGDVLPQLPALAMADEVPGDGSTRTQDTAFRDVSVDEANALISGEAALTVLDVRTPQEFAEGHIEGAVNIDVNSDSFVADIAALDKNATYVVHCRSGKRSLKALDAMRTARFSSVAHMDAGMNGWTQANLPVTK